MSAFCLHFCKRPGLTLFESLGGSLLSRVHYLTWLCTDLYAEVVAAHIYYDRHPAMSQHLKDSYIVLNLAIFHQYVTENDREFLHSTRSSGVIDETAHNVPEAAAAGPRSCGHRSASTGK